MIHELVTKPGGRKLKPQWDTIPFLKERMVFKPGMNIVFGPNASGKSTLINTLALLMHCDQAGFQKITETSLRALGESVGKGDDRKLALPDQKVLHSGCDTRFVSAERVVGYHESELDHDFIQDQIGLMRAKRTMSSGQMSVVKVNRIFQQKVRTTPIEQSIRSSQMVGPWQPLLEEIEKNMAGAPTGDNKLCFLMDEPDRSLDFLKQATVWEALRSHNSLGMAQFIIASHSPFALDIPEANYIETEPGAMAAMRSVLAKWGWERKSVPDITPLTKKAPAEPAKTTKKRKKKTDENP